MAYDEKLAARVRRLLVRRHGLYERRMFGGIAFMLHGNMVCGVLDDYLILRLGPGFKQALARPHTRPFDFTGRPMKNLVVIEPAGCASSTSLRTWVKKAADFASSLPPK